MIPKLQEYMNNERSPLFIRLRKGIIYFQLQIEIAREDGFCAGTYCEYEKLKVNSSAEEIGNVVKKMLSRFQTIGDLTLYEFQNMTSIDIDVYKNQENDERKKFLEVKTDKELNDSFLECGIQYNIKTNSYFFQLFWIYKEGRKKWNDSSDSKGKEGILTFDEPLEFDDNISSERLGKMLLEAFDRSIKMAEKMSK